MTIFAATTRGRFATCSRSSKSTRISQSKSSRSTQPCARARSSSRTWCTRYRLEEAGPPHRSARWSRDSRLRHHPQIYMPDHKEPWFFARSNPHPQTNGERSIAFTGKRMETLEDYLTLFRDANADQLVGEASTSYLWSTTAARRIAEVRPDA